MSPPKRSGPGNVGAIPTRDEVVRDVLNIRDAEPRSDGREYQIRRLRQALRNRQGRFAILFAVGNDPAQQREITGQVFSDTDIPAAVELDLDEKEDSLLAALLSARGAPAPLTVFGIEKLLPSSRQGKSRREKTLRELQYRRELFRTVGRPIIIWMPEYVFSLIGQQATDFWSWQSGTFFFTANADRSKRLHHFVPKIVLDPLLNLDVSVQRPEFEEVMKLIAAGRNALVCGAKGSGKTFLALAVAQAAHDLFPDGTVLVSFEEVGGGNAAAEAALAHIVRTLVPTAELAVGVHALRATYDDVMQGRRLLVVADDVPDAETARLLIPHSPSQLLMTSSAIFNLPAAKTVMLSGLRNDDALRFLATHLPAVDFPIAAKLAQAAEGSPMALRLIAGVLNVAPESVDELTSLLAGHDRPLQLQRLIERAYQHLGQEKASNLLSLSVFESDFNTEAASAVCELPMKEHLEELTQFGLLDVNREVRFRLHPAVRDFILGRIDSEKEHEARRRHALHFATVLKDMDDAYDAPDSDMARARLQRLQLDWPNIRQGQSWAASHSQNDEGIAFLTTAYALMARNVLSARLSPGERLLWYEAAADAAPLAGQSDFLPVIYEELAEASVAVGDRSRAKNYEDRALEGHRKLVREGRPDTNSLALSAAYLALSQRAMEEGRYDEALEFYRALQAFSAKSGLPLQEAATWLQIGGTQAARGDLDSAEVSCLRSLEVVPEGAERGLRMRAYSLLGEVARAKGEFAKAKDWYERALREAEQVGHSSIVAETFLRLGQLALEEDELDRSESLIRRASDLLKRLGDHPRQIRAQLQLSLIAQHRSDLDAAERYASRALQAATELEAEPERGYALHRLGGVIEQRGDLARATELYQSSAHILVRLNLSAPAGAVYYDLAKLLAMRGANQDAIAANLQSLVLRMEAEPKEVLGNILFLARQERVLGRDGLEAALKQHMGNEEALALLGAVDEAASRVAESGPSER